MIVKGHTIEPGADLRDADLRDADLRNADLRNADLRNADIWGANLNYANLHGADLRNADLGGADLRNVDLGGADLRNANLDFAAWPLWCGSLGVVLDDRLKAQLLYHVIDAVGVERFTDKQIEFANTFHRVGEVPRLEPVD
jgi:hypothetical protein